MGVRGQLSASGREKQVSCGKIGAVEADDDNDNWM